MAHGARKIAGNVILPSPFLLYFSSPTAAHGSQTFSDACRVTNFSAESFPYIMLLPDCLYIARDSGFMKRLYQRHFNVVLALLKAFRDVACTIFINLRREGEGHP